MVLSACGSGSSNGTDENGVLYYGSLVARSGRGVSNATIFLYETGESATTDDSGAFILESFEHLTSVGFFVQKNGFSNTICVEPIPDLGSEFSLALRFDETNKQISLLSFEDGQPRDSSPEPGTTPTPAVTNEDTGAISRGRGIWSSTCARCHAREKTGRSVSTIQRALRAERSMQSISLSNREVSDVVAYLNRRKR